MSKRTITVDEEGFARVHADAAIIVLVLKMWNRALDRVIQTPHASTIEEARDTLRDLRVIASELQSQGLHMLKDVSLRVMADAGEPEGGTGRHPGVNSDDKE